MVLLDRSGTTMVPFGANDAPMAPSSPASCAEMTRSRGSVSGRGGSGAMTLARTARGPAIAATAAQATPPPTRRHRPRAGAVRQSIRRSSPRDIVDVGPAVEIGVLGPDHAAHSFGGRVHDT